MKNKKSKSKKQEKKPNKSKSKSKSKPKPKKENPNSKTFKTFLIICVAIIILVLAVYFYVNSLKTYTYEGVDFKTVQEGDLILYQTSIPVLNQGTVVPYNFYLRTNPRDLKKVEFDNSEFEIMTNTVLNFKDEFDCEGYGIIAIANLVQLHGSMEINIIKDDNATCDERYLLLNLVKGEETKIQKIENGCYDVVISNCEILKGTERIMLEMFVKYAEL